MSQRPFQKHSPASLFDSSCDERTATEGCGLYPLSVACAQVPVDQPGRSVYNSYLSPRYFPGAFHATLDPFPPRRNRHPSRLSSSRHMRRYCTVGATATGCNLVPIKGFVHEVLRRSRTSRSVIQTALCWKSRKSFGTRRERGRDGAELRETQVALYHLTKF
jgi:hypothetical protein